MAWHVEGGRSYYYRSQWIDGRPVRKYVGTGEVAEAVATADALRRVEREIQARRWREEQARREAAAALLLEIDRVADLVARAVLLAAGYHQHHHSWRFARVRHHQPQND